MISRWIPISEKGLAASMYTTGAQLAGAFGIPFSTILCVSEWQWPAVYYITGRGGILKGKLKIFSIVFTYMADWILFYSYKQAKLKQDYDKKRKKLFA